MVSEEARCSVPVDPLEAYSGLSLFPTVFRVLPDPSKPYDREIDLDALHRHLKSTALRSPSKFVEQAKTIVDGNSEILNSETLSLAPKVKNEEFNVQTKENAQERRPALNRKRAKFSLKPNSSQPAVNLEPTLDITQLKDPEEFFLAYERIENAKREIQKQMGCVSKDLDQQNIYTTARQRRPGLLGRSVKYKHRYSSLISQNDENIVSSQDTIEASIQSPPTVISQQEDDENVLLQERELADSITKAENKVNEILGELLSANSEDLEGDGAVNLLQERLRIKPMDIEKLCLPDFQKIQRISLKSSRVNEPKRRNALSDIDNLLKGITPTKRKLTQDVKSSILHLASPTPPKSPFASLSLLKRSILQPKISSIDPFSAHDIDRSPGRNPSLFERINNLTDSGSKSAIFDEPKSVLSGEAGVAVQKAVTHDVSIRDFYHTTETSSNENSNKFDTGSSRTHIYMEDNIAVCNGDEVMNDKLSSSNAHVDALANGPSELEGKKQVEEHEELASGEPDAVANATVEHASSVPVSSTATVIEDQTVNGLSRSLDTGLEQHHEEILEVAGESLKQQGKEKSFARKRQKGKEYTRRQSLAAAGTSWQSGVRRSTRIRTRPLEYWKGERLLYGRIHESLTTVIGLKYASPAKGNEQPALKVKSYVSDEYKSLVEFAALH